MYLHTICMSDLWTNVQATNICIPFFTVMREVQCWKILTVAIQRQLFNFCAKLCYNMWTFCQYFHSFVSISNMLSVFPVFWHYFQGFEYLQKVGSISNVISIFPAFCQNFQRCVHMSCSLSVSPAFCPYLQLYIWTSHCCMGMI